MSGPTNSSPPQRLQVMQQTATALNELLEKLYPESPSPDVITLDDFLTRYRLTELGAPAVQAIQQTQRINRTLNNYRQMGLSEFHIGLFYLHWGDCQGGIKQFALARQQWSFVDAAASVCLAHFAEGLAHHLAYQYEVAMNHYGKAVQWLARTHFTPPSASQDEFVGKIRQCLEERQTKLREDMLAYFTAGQATRQARVTADEEEQPKQKREPKAETPAQESEEGDTLPPEDTPVTPRQVAPLPYFNIDAEPDWTKTPIPAHRNLDEKYAWYRVEETDQHFLPEVVKGTWVLVDQETANHEFKQDELIVVIRSDDIGGGIVLKPRAPVQPFQRIYLGTSRITGKFTITDTGRVILAPDIEQRVNLADILGFVVGFWLPSQNLAAPGEV